MRSVTTRYIIVLLAALIGVILFLQVYWLRNTYRYEHQAFQNAVVKTIRGVYEDMNLVANAGTHMNTLVERPDSYTFQFRIDQQPQYDSLRFFVVSELEDFLVFSDCMLSVYDPAENKEVYAAYIPSAASMNEAPHFNTPPLPRRSFRYVQLYFPFREKYVLAQMEGWMFTSGLVVLLLIALVLFIYYFFRQKFLNEVQRDFIHNVTHEFSTPLTIIGLSTDALGKPQVLAQPEKINRYVSAISLQKEYLQKHIQSLVRTITTDKAGFSIQKQAVVPNNLVRMAVAQLETLTLERNARIGLELEADNRPIDADADQLYLALFNLLTNALKYSPEPVVTITTRCDERHYYIAVTDNGIGIAPAQVRRIFHKFYRVQDGALQNARGLGLGLYFTHKVIGLHGGRVTVNSTPGKGSTFTIVLPIA